MKSWRRTLAIGFIIAITSQLYWNVFVNNFRVSASVILLPVLIMTVGSQIHTMTICTVTSIIVFLFRIVIYLSAGNAIRDAGTACDARSVLLYRVRHDVQAADPE